MDLSRAVYSRDLKIATMRALDSGSTPGEIARKYQLSPKLLERWRGEWRARGESAFPGIGRCAKRTTKRDNVTQRSNCIKAKTAARITRPCDFQRCS